MSSPFDLAGQAENLVARLPVAVSVVDPEGRLLYYNPRAAEILDRKPEYLGRDVRECHKKPESAAKIDRCLAAYQEGQDRLFFWQVQRDGQTFAVTLAPWRENGKLLGAIHTVTLLAGMNH